MGTAHRLLRTPSADSFVKQYPSSADEAVALELPQAAWAAGVPVRRVVSSFDGEVVGSEDGLALALIEHFRDTTSGAVLTIPEMVQAGYALGRLRACLSGRSGLRDIAAKWLAFGERRERLPCKRCFPTPKRCVVGTCDSAYGKFGERETRIRSARTVTITRPSKARQYRSRTLEIRAMH